MNNGLRNECVINELRTGFNKPTWTDANFLQKMLRKSENDESIEVVDVIENSATAIGDNYACKMERVSIIFMQNQDNRKIQQKKSFIAKIVPQTPWEEKLIMVGGHFETESSMIMNTLPKMNEALIKLGMTPLSGKCLYSQGEKPYHLLIEDLLPKGFHMGNRINGLDLDHCLLAIRNIARFHASSVAVKEKDPKIIITYKKGLYCKDRPSWMNDCFKFGMKALGEEVAKWPELNPSISEKILKLSDIAFIKACKASRVQDDEFNVLNHGDCWTNNMLFRYDNRKKPIEHVFVDFQLSVYGSPVIDILHFLASSPSDDVRKNHRNLLLREYYKTLASTMEKLKCKTRTPSFEELKKVLKERAFLEVITVFTTLPILLTDENKVKPLKDFMEPIGEYENPGYQEKQYQEIIKRVLPLYESMGLLDD